MTNLKAVNQHLVDYYEELSHMEIDKVVTIGEFKRCLHSKMRHTHVFVSLLSNLFQSVKASRYLSMLTM